MSTTNDSNANSNQQSVETTDGVVNSSGNRRGIRAQYPMISNLGDHSVATVVEQAAILWGPDGLGLYPSEITKILKPAHQIRDWAATHGIERLADLTGPIAATMLRDITDIADLTKVSKHKKLDRLHRLRNTLVALRGVVLIADDGQDRLRAYRPKGDSLAADLPTVAARSSQKRRPLEDDEILLGRTLVEIDLREHGEVLPIFAYLIAESGVRCQPSSTVTTDSFNKPVDPTKVRVPGVWGLKDRKVKFSPYVARSLARTLARTPAGTRPLTYTGKNPGKESAGASLTPVIQRFLRRAGIDSPEVTQSSLVLWRPWHALTAHNDMLAARKYHGGRATENLLADLHCLLDEEDLDSGCLRVIHRPTGRKVARVRALHC